MEDGVVMVGIGILEANFLIAAVISAIWVFFDAPKFGLNRYIASLVTLLVMYPLGFAIYLAYSRLRKRIVAN